LCHVIAPGKILELATFSDCVTIKLAYHYIGGVSSLELLVDYLPYLKYTIDPREKPCGDPAYMPVEINVKRVWSSLIDYSYENDC